MRMCMSRLVAPAAIEVPSAILIGTPHQLALQSPMPSLVLVPVITSLYVGDLEEREGGTETGELLMSSSSQRSCGSVAR